MVVSGVFTAYRKSIEKSGKKEYAEGVRRDGRINRIYFRHLNEENGQGL